MKQSSRAWIFVILGLFLCASLLVAKTPEVKAIDPTGPAPRTFHHSTSTQPTTFPQNFRAEVAYGVVCYDPSGALSDGPVTFALDTPGTMTQLAEDAGELITASSIDAEQTWYAIEYYSHNLVTFDYETGARTVVATITAPGGRTWTGMAFDFSTMTMYGICYSSGVDAALCTIDLDSYEVAVVGTTTDLTTPINLACSNEGQLYLVDIGDDNLYRMDKTDASVEVVGAIGFDCIYAQDMAFDHDENILYMGAYSDALDGELRTVNLQTGATTVIGALQGGVEMPGFVIPSYPAEPGAPAAPTNFVLTPDAGGALECELSWTNPSETFDGETLTELDVVVVYRNDELIYTLDNPTIGANVTWTDDTMDAPLMAVYRVFGSNTEGDGPAVTGNAWVGEDVPAAVTDLVLTANNYNGRLTWTNPTTGLHGGPFNNPITGYRLERSDGEVINITGQTTMYDDTTIEFGGTYFYEVSAVNASGVGAPAVSNGCLILTPGTMVYADFETGDMPEGWTEEFVSGTSSWIFQAGGYSSHPATAHGGEYNALLYVGNSNGDITRLVSPQFNITDGAVLSFWHTQPIWATDQDQMTLVYRNTPDGEWTEIQSWTESITDWTEEVITLPNASTTYQIAFEGLAIYGYGIGIDDVIVSGEAGEVGTIEGTVTLNGGSGVITEVEVEAGGTMVHPDLNGDYAITLATGTYDVTATLFGYADVVVENVVVQADQTTDNVDFTLIPNPNVTVTGRCVGSDYPNVGLANVQIDITGYDTYQAFTNADGYFTIDGVWADHTYQITAMVEGYDMYVGEAIVGDSDTDLGDIILPEIASPPYNLIATQNAEGTEAYLVWNSPTGSLESFFDFDSDDGEFVSSDPVGWQWGQDTTNGYHSEPNVWATVLNNNYANSANWWLDSPEIIVSNNSVLTFWHYYNTEGSATYTYDGGNVKISIDGGDSWEVINPVGEYPSPAAHANNVAIPGEPCYFGTSEGWVLATFDLAAYVGEEAMFRWHFGSDGSVNGYRGWYIDDVRVGMPEERFALQQDSDNLHWVSNIATTRDRIIEQFAVYRMLLGEEDTPENWTLVNYDVADTTYTDTDWADVDTNIYQYAVRAIYTNGIESEATVSDWLAKDYYTTCTVTVNSATGDPLDGTVINLTCQSADPDGVYPEYEQVLEDGATSAYFPMVWRGIYDVTVVLEGAEPIQEVHDINNPAEITVTLTELTPPVSGIDATVTDNDVTLMWRTPSASSEFNFDDDDCDFVSNDAAGWQWGEDATTGAHSEPNVWGTKLNSQYTNDANWTLDSPEISIGGNSVLTFWHYYNSEGSDTYTYDAGNVKISVDGGDTWTVITPEGGYPSPAAYSTNAAIPGEPCYFGNSDGWVQAVFNLEAYSGQTAMFRWHFGTDGSVTSYIGWYIDDVYVGAPETRVALNNRTRNSANRNDRALEGYELYRNTVLIDGTLTPADTVYVDQDLADGVYTYEVVAVYTTGNADPASVTVQVYPLDITGTVYTSDNPEVGIDGALVVLENEEYYWEATTVDGEFAFFGVNGMQTYTLTITYEGGDAFYEPYTTEITVTDQDVPLGDITLSEITPAPGAVIATENTDHTEVDLVWGTPGSGSVEEFRYDDGNIISQLGWGSSSEVRLGATHYHNAEIQSITWYLTSNAAHTACDLYIYGVSEDGTPNAEDVLFEMTNVPSVDDSWNTYELETPVEAPNGFFVGVNTPTAFVALGTDDGVDDPYVFQPGTQWATNTVSTNEWHDIQEFDFPVNYAIRVSGYDYGELDTRHHHVASTPDSKAKALDAPTLIPGYVMNKNESRTVKGQKEEAPTFGSFNSTVNTTRDRALIGYDIYRLDVEDIDNPELWDHLTDEYVTDTTFVDVTWEDVPSGVYQWAVFAMYTNDNPSDPRFSNEVPRDMTAAVTINVTTNSGDSPAGATVSLVNQDGDEAHVYEAVVPASGSIFFPAVWLGFYNLTVELDGFDVYVENNVIVDDPEDGEEFDIELEEALTAVIYGQYEVDGGDVHLWWNEPGVGNGADFSEDFESGDLSTGWSTEGISTDTSGSTPGYFTVSDYSSDTFAPYGTYHAGLWWSNSAQDEWLITPEFSCGANTSITWSCVAYEGSTYNDHYYLKVSDDGGDTWEAVWDASALTGAAWNYYDHDYTIDLSDYNGSDITLAWNCVDGDSQGLWYVFFVDNITVTSGDTVIHFDGSDLTQESRSSKTNKVQINHRDRALLGYKIVRGGEVIVELQSDREYFDLNRPSGTWTYFVYAVYSTGDAEPLVYSGIVSNDDVVVPEYSTELVGNCPNPFNPQTSINFSLAEPGKVTIDIYNIKGQKVRSLVNDKYDQGNHKVVWNGTDDTNRGVGSGIYFYKMKSGRYTSTKKMILLK